MARKVIRKPIPIALSSGYMTQLTNESGGAREYEVNGKTYQSVTSLISRNLRNFGLEKWKDGWINDQLSYHNGKKLTPQIATDIVSASTDEMNASADLGTQMHTIIEGLLRDENVDDLITDQLEPAVRAWLKWRKKFIDWELVGTEVGVFAGDTNLVGTVFGIPYAGQVDALFRMGNHYMVVDWKTSSGLYDSSFLQVGAYAYALKDMYSLSWGSSDILKHRDVNSVSACVVRMMNDYPRDAKGKKNRREPKIFTDQCEYVMVNVDHWSRTFRDMASVSSRLRHKIEKVRL